MAQIAQYRIVIHADHGDVFRHGHVDAIAGIQHVLAARVAARHHSHRPAQRLEPAPNLLLLALPRPRPWPDPRRFPVLTPAVPALGQPSDEPLAPADRPGLVTEPAEREASESALHQVIRRLHA